MKTAFVTTLDEKSVPGFLISLYTLIKCHSPFNDDIVILIWDNISAASKEQIYKIYKNIKYKNIDILSYKKNEYDSTYRKWLYNCAYRFDIFLLSEYDKIVFFDNDLFFQTRLHEVNNPCIRFGAVRRHHVSQVPDNKGFSAGLMIIDKTFLNIDTKKELLRIYEQKAYPDKYVLSKKWVGNEPILNLFFLNKDITWLPSQNNVCIDEFTINTDINNVNLHFIGSKKPWHSSTKKDQYDPYIEESLAKINGKYMSSVLLQKLSTKFKEFSRDCQNYIESKRDSI